MSLQSLSTAIVLVMLAGQSFAADREVTGASAIPATQPTTSPTAGFTAIREAPQPAGFPQLGPVGQIVVKEYPAYRLARTGMSGEGQNSAFRVLFNHIKANDISMTSPVEMTYEAGGQAEDANVEEEDQHTDLKPTSMAFLYRDAELGELGKQADVEVVDVPARTVVSVAVRGDYTEARLSGATEQLEEWLAANPEFERDGPPRYMGYNSPMVPSFLRYGEVQIPVQKTNGETSAATSQPNR